MRKARSGFTLVELLVVIAIIGILMGLLIPAVNAAREAARLRQCSTNIRNFSLGAIQYEGNKGRLPSWVQSYGDFEGTTDPSDPSATAANHAKIGTWAVALLPYLDGQPTYEIWTEDRYPVVVTASTEFPPSDAGFSANAAPNLEVFQCPSSPTSEGGFGRNSYISNNGLHHLNADGNALDDGAGGIDFDASQGKANGAFVNGLDRNNFRAGRGVSLDDMKDGQGYTVLFSENLQARPWHRAGFLNRNLLSNSSGVSYPAHSRFTTGMVWHWADPDQFNSVSSTNSQEIKTIWRINGGDDSAGKDKFSLEMESGLTNVAANADLARPSSAHTDGVNMAFADNSVRFIQDSIDYRVYQALMTPRGKSSNVPFNEYILKGEEL